MPYKAWFQCINEKCNQQYPLNKIIYRCTSCDSLLEVKHDMQALAHRSATAWMKLFEDRYKSTQWPYGSGIWGKKEWVPRVRPTCAQWIFFTGGLSLRSARCRVKPSNSRASNQNSVRLRMALADSGGSVR